jgi:hypothetical protein
MGGSDRYAVVATCSPGIRTGSGIGKTMRLLDVVVSGDVDHRSLWVRSRRGRLGHGLVRQPQSVISPACRDREGGHRVINFKVCWILKLTGWPRPGL